MKRRRLLGHCFRCRNAVWSGRCTKSTTDENFALLGELRDFDNRPQHYVCLWEEQSEEHDAIAKREAEREAAERDADIRRESESNMLRSLALSVEGLLRHQAAALCREPSLTDKQVAEMLPERERKVLLIARMALVMTGDRR